MSYAEEKKTAYELIEKLAAKEAYTPDEIVFNVSRITGLGTLCLKRFISDGILHKLFYVNNQDATRTLIRPLWTCLEHSLSISRNI